MGFVTGFLGGVTLTTSLLYLSIHIHQRTRLEQALLLRQQSLLLTHILDPLPPSQPPPYAREARVSVVETAKDRWNAEIAGVVRRATYTDWTAVREQMEVGAGRAWARIWPKVKEGVDGVKDGVESVRRETGRIVREGEEKVEGRLRGREG